MTMRKIYYQMKPLIPRKLQIAIRKKIVVRKKSKYSDIWPIDPQACKPPAEWIGWPEGKQFALVLTHDVENDIGQQRCYDLMKLEESVGFRSLFNFVPERYGVLPELRASLVRNGFEVGVHGLKHDGKLFSCHEIFRERAGRINHYLAEWNAVGFRSPANLRNLNWLHELDIEYDSSTFDTDPFEPQPHGVGTIFPFEVNGIPAHKKYVEMPYTLPQDFTLFILMREKSIDIWKRKLDWIAEHGGMALLNTHPDYINFNGKKLGIEEYPAEYYEEFLQYIKNRYNEEYWHVLPRQIARFWAERNVNATYSKNRRYEES